MVSARLVSARRGSSSLGCLMPLLVISAIAYFAVNIGEVYWRFYRFRDAMAQEVRFAARRTDDEILRNLRSKADSIGLPESAQNIEVEREKRTIRVYTNYYEHIELPLVVREIHFHPRAEGTY
jgi:hypothetical protein